jgi:hypothetical protein
MADYCTIENVLLAGHQLSTDDHLVIPDLVSRCSRLFDRACRLPDNHFAEAATAASARKFWGDGTNNLRIDPYVAGSITTVTMPTGYTVPDYVEEVRPDNTGSYLICVYGDDESKFSGVEAEAIDLFSVAFWNASYIGWPEGIKVTVTARWGFSAVPVEVVEAVTEWVIATLRGKDQAYAKVVNLENGQIVTAAMPERTKMLADSFRNNRLVFA